MPRLANNRYDLAIKEALVSGPTLSVPTIPTSAPFPPTNSTPVGAGNGPSCLVAAFAQDYAKYEAQLVLPSGLYCFRNFNRVFSSN